MLIYVIYYLLILSWNSTTSSNYLFKSRGTSGECDGRLHCSSLEYSALRGTDN